MNKHANAFLEGTITFEEATSHLAETDQTTFNEASARLRAALHGHPGVVREPATACPHCLSRELQLDATRQVTAHVLFSGAGDQGDAEVQH